VFDARFSLSPPSFVIRPEHFPTPPSVGCGEQTPPMFLILGLLFSHTKLPVLLYLASSVDGKLRFFSSALLDGLLPRFRIPTTVLLTPSPL